MKVSVWSLGAVWIGLLWGVACSDSERPSGPPGSEQGGEGSGRAGSISNAGSSDAEAGRADGGASEGGADTTAAGESGTGDGGIGGSAAGSSAGGSGGTGNVGGGTPPVGDPPLCVHDASFEAGTLIALSGGGDDLLQAITPDELTIAWKNGTAFFTADRTVVGDPFETPQPVAGGDQFNSVALGSDGLLLVGVTKDLRVVEMVRGAGQAFDDANPGAGSFAEFNATLSTIPYASQLLIDAVLAPNDASFLFSHLWAAAGPYPALFESYSSGGYWAFPSEDLGSVLYANAGKRRAPTGVSSDRLTLFYRDEIEGDFRAAWRINTQQPFTTTEVLALGTGVQAAAPNANCQRVYFSAQGASDLDLFVSNVTP